MLSLVFGASAYGIAFAFVERERTPANFYFYTTAGAAFVLAGATFLMPEGPRGLFWAALAVGAALGARRAGRATLAGHAATYAVAAALSSGLLAHAVEATVESPAIPWSPASLAAVGAAVAVAVAAWALGAAPIRGPLDRVPRVVLLVVLAVSSAGLAVGWLAPLFAGLPGASADAGVVATVRTVVLSFGALALALAARFERWSEARWLTWPVLALAGLKLLLEDMHVGRPATQFLAFGLYGAALILVPRLRRREPALPPPPQRTTAGA